MPKNQYISLILFLIVFVTFVNLYYKPQLTERDPPLSWIAEIIHPIQKSICPLQGFKCPSNEACDCEKVCSNGDEFVQFEVLEGKDRIYVMNKKLAPGTYCLPKGIGQCNLKTSYHVFTLAGWSCLGLNDDVFKGDKKKACRNEEARDDDLNVLYDNKLNQVAEDNIDDYYERDASGNYRYSCKCGSDALDGTPMVSVLPFVCSVDYCLRDIEFPLQFMGWDGDKCECGPYKHLDPDDPTSPCRREVTRVERDQELVGRVDCMTKNSFVKHPLICPTDESNLKFQEQVFFGNEPTLFVERLITQNII